MASIVKRCDCPQADWRTCPHAWVVRYRTPGGRSGRQQEQSFDQGLAAAEDFALKVEHDKRARTFIDPKAGAIPFSVYAEQVIGHRYLAESTEYGYLGVLRRHINPAFGLKALNVIRREDIKRLVATMRRAGLGAGRIHGAYLVVNLVFNEAVRDKKITETPCFDIELPELEPIDFIIPDDAQVDALEAGLPPRWRLTVKLMKGCGLRAGEALAVNKRCRIQGRTLLRIREQVNPRGELRPLKARRRGDFRDVPLPTFADEAIDEHLDLHGCTSDGYLIQGLRKKLVVRESYHRHFRPAARAAGLPEEFVPHWLRHYYASVSLAGGIPITDLSAWLGHSKIEITYQIYRHLIPGNVDRARHILDNAFARPLPRAA